MITQEQLGTLVVKRVIFHDVPNSLKSAPGKEPTLSDVETSIDTTRKALLRKKLVEVVGSQRAYPVVFLPAALTRSSVPPSMVALTKNAKALGDFVEVSRKLALELFDKQIGSVSPGLLCMIDVVMDSRIGIVLMKLERHEGAQLTLQKDGNKQTFAMSVLDDLVLTDGTRLFKTALFLRTGLGDEDFESVVCDNQVSTMTSDSLAKFWMTFLGCTFADDPRVTTQQFFDASVRFINQQMTDPVQMSDLYDSLQAELKSNKANFTPKSFIDNHIPDEYRAEYRTFLTEQRVPLTSFKKDLHDINNRLRRRIYMTRSGAFVSVPETHVDVVEVTEEKITILDSVSRVK